MKSTTENREEKFAMVRRWEASGLTQKTFCLQEGIPGHHFNYWFKKFRDENGLAPSTGKFIKLKPPVKEMAQGIYAEVIFRNGNCLRLHQQVSGVELKQLVS